MFELAEAILWQVRLQQFVGGTTRQEFVRDWLFSETMRAASAARNLPRAYQPI